MAIVNSNISICSTPVNTDYYINGGSGATDNRQYFSVLGTDIYDVAGVNEYTTIFENDILRITASHDNRSRPGMNSILFYDKVNSVEEYYIDCGNLRHCYLALGYDDETQEAYFYLAGQYYYTGEWNVQSAQQYSTNGIYGVHGYTRIYELISGSQIPPERSGGAGSGYIGNPLLSNKKMVGYNVPTSSAESTKTESVNEASENPVSGKPKIGNGFARIKFLKTIAPPDEWKTEVEALKDFEIADKKFIHSDIPAGFDGDGFTNKGDYTYVCVSSSTNWQTTFNFSHIATIRVTTNSGGGYDVAYENLDHVYMGFQSHISMYGFGMCQLCTGSIDPYYFWPYNSITWQVSYEMATNQTHFDNLTNLFKYLNVHYRNINLYVDGECWALAGTW